MSSFEKVINNTKDITSFSNHNEIIDHFKNSINNKHYKYYKQYFKNLFQSKTSHEPSIIYIVSNS